MNRFIFLVYVIVFISTTLKAENGYDLWLKYRPVEDNSLKMDYSSLFSKVFLQENGSTATVLKEELIMAANKLTGVKPQFVAQKSEGLNFILTTSDSLLKAFPEKDKGNIHEGFMIKRNGKSLDIMASTEIGLLYGMFRILRCMNMGIPVSEMQSNEMPRIQLRMLNHWDNLTRTVERGYAGQSIWNWHTLPDFIDQRYIDYARANASIGINAVALTNVNANATVLTPMYLKKVKALADVFRPYGIKVFLTARFSAPIEIGKLKTADPADETVQRFWKEKAKEIYELIPDFGGFLVKANSEGQPGPQEYGRNHADGANMLAAWKV